MKIVLLLVVLLVAGLAITINARRRVAREEAAQALARAKAAARRPKVPAVSNNLKGVTASQTMSPFRPKQAAPDDDGGDDERAA
jgi:hypothetical protein